MGIVYLDYAATTPISKNVRDAMVQALDTHWGNPSSQYSLGRQARARVEQARQSLGTFFHLPYRGFTFCSGATEANHAVILGNSRRIFRASGKKHLITSAIEHPSVLEAFRQLESEGFRVSYVPVLETGVVDLEVFEDLLDSDTALVSIMYVNNETGAIQPLEQIASLLEGQGVFFHSDIVQGLGKSNVYWPDLGLDAFSATAHKIYGPKGVGFFYQDPNIPFLPSIKGGHQESDRRAGTENVQGIIGLEQAIMDLNRERDSLAEERLIKFFFDRLDALNISWEQNGTGGIPSILSLYLPGMLATQVLIQLDLQGICVSAGSACSAGSVEKSHVLTAMYGKHARVKETIRISIGRETSEQALEILVQALAKIRG